MIKSIHFSWMVLFQVITLQSSCKHRNVGSKSLENSNFNTENGVEKGCSERVFNVTMGDKPTRVYHWTNWPSAASNPQGYIDSLFKLLKEQHSRGVHCGMAGCGMYAAQDPYQSSSYGETLVEFDVKAETRFVYGGGDIAKPVNNNPDILESGCDGKVYGWAAAANLNRPEAKRTLAIAIHNPASINLASVKAYTFKSNGDVQHEGAGAKRLLTSEGFRASYGNELDALAKGISNLKADSTPVQTAFVSNRMNQCFSELPPFKFPASIKDQALVEAENALAKIPIFLTTEVTENWARGNGNCGDGPAEQIAERLKQFLESCGKKLGIQITPQIKTCQDMYTLVHKWKPAKADLVQYVNEMRTFWQTELLYLDKQYTFADWKIIPQKRN